MNVNAVRIPHEYDEGIDGLAGGSSQLQDVWQEDHLKVLDF